MKNKIVLEYVSGSINKNLRISNRDKELQDENIKDITNLVHYTQQKLHGHFKFSVLSNAYTEEKEADMIRSNDNFGHDWLYTDSGGLQVLTQGLEITDEVKDKVYAVQAKYSDYAMSFDEMPLMVVPENATGSVNGDVGQVYVDELIKPTAKLSAKHIQRQIDTFQKLKADTKILPVLHGYDPESFIKYGSTIFNNLKDIGDHIQGVSIASLRGHSDSKVGVMKMFDYVPKILNSGFIDDKYLSHIHLLGVARHQRIMPIIMMIKKGLLPDAIKKISFDSTAITKSYTFGKVYQNVEEYKNPRNYSSALTMNDYRDKNHRNVEQFYRNVFEFVKDYPNNVFEDWEDIAKHSPNNGLKMKPTEMFEKYGRNFQRKYLAQMRYSSMYHAYTYLSVIEAYINDELDLDTIFGYNDSIKFIFKTFESANTLEEFADMCDYFYTTAKTGRTNLRIQSCKTVKEFEEKFLSKQKCLLEELGIEKGVEILNEELKKPWIKSSMKRAKKGEVGENPADSLF
jgi:hypothetical protein